MQLKIIIAFNGITNFSCVVTVLVLKVNVHFLTWISFKCVCSQSKGFCIHVSDESRGRDYYVCMEWYDEVSEAVIKVNDERFCYGYENCR
jgi:hypothetical protein